MSENLAYNSVRCTFCPELKGIMKYVKNSRKVKSFAHVACVNWAGITHYSDFKSGAKETI